MTPAEYTAALLALERQWAAEISAVVARVSKALPGYPISEGWVRSLADESHPLTRAHIARVDALDRLFYEPLFAELAEGNDNAGADCR